MKYAILSTDNNPDYYSLLPLVCHSWRKIGYTPVIIFVNVPKQVMDTVMSFCPGSKWEEKFSIDGVKGSTTAQLSRLYAYQGLKDDDIIITGDSDMVIGTDIFTHDVGHGQIVSYGFDLTGRSELPICYIKATGKKWHELIKNNDSAFNHIPESAYSDMWESYWSTDQQLLTQRAREYGMGRITFVDRGNQNKHGLPTGRWDRFDWAHIPDSIIDVHMKRGDWQAQIQVFERLWPDEDYSFITKFREALEGQKEVSAITGKDAKLKGTWQEFCSYTESQKELIDIALSDTHEFLKGSTGNWNNHLPFLLLGLHLTNGLVIEFGSGEGSTKRLRDYCNEHNRSFESWDSDSNWAKITGANYTSSWDLPSVYRECGLFFCDHAPGEHRIVAIEKFANLADVIIIHDTEEGGAGDYKYDRIWRLFKYRLNYNKTGGGAGATLVSNKIDVNRFRGLSLGQFTFDND